MKLSEKMATDLRGPRTRPQEIVEAEKAEQQQQRVVRRRKLRADAEARFAELSETDQMLARSLVVPEGNKNRAERVRMAAELYADGARSCATVAAMMGLNPVTAWSYIIDPTGERNVAHYHNRKRRHEAREAAAKLDPPVSRDDVGAKLVRLRKAAGLSQAALAQATGFSRSTIGDWERGTQRPSQSAWEKLTKALFGG